MSQLDPGHFDEQLRKYQARDPELYEEIMRKVSGRSQEPRVAATRRALGLAEEAPLVAEGGTATPLGQMFIETIVQPIRRPVLAIRNNRATTEFLSPQDSSVWTARIQSAQAVLDRAIPTVGRIELNNNPDYTWVGTGWLVAQDIVVTNRHVASIFAQRGANGFTFRVGLNNTPQTSRIDFLEESMRRARLEYAINSVLWIALPDGPDIAFLRVTRTAAQRPLAAPVMLADAAAVDDFVATIGYPARDPRVPDQDLVRQIFGDIYDKKRLAPGQLVNVSAGEIEHDCSTLGGNSGSLLVNLASGQAVGLHFAGLYMRANYAVPAPRIGEFLQKVQRGELPDAAPIQPTSAPAPTAAEPAAVSPGTYTFQLQIPIEITIKVGTATSAHGALAAASGDPYENALQAARQALAGDPDILEIRLGYRFKRGWITDERVIVVEVREKKSVTELRAQGKTLIPPQILGVGVDVRTAAFADQLEALGIDLKAVEAPSHGGVYREPPDLSLDLVKEPMRAIFHASPDSGFPNLKLFFERVQHHLTATIYEWDAKHISNAIAAAIEPADNTLQMVTQRPGTKKAVMDMQTRLGSKFKHVWASVGAGKIVPSAYHIKVASRDGEEFWLSSGNWKNSNQANIDPAGEDSTRVTPLRQHNREWHAIIANQKLATLFQEYIEYDFSEAERVPLEEAVEIALPDLFVPESAFMEGVEARFPVQYFDPLVLDRELEIQPLLTPDHDERGNHIFIWHALEMIKKGTSRIYVENQSFNLIDTGDADFIRFFEVLRDKQKEGKDVRIIFRDAREFPSNDVKQQKLIEHLKEFGFDTDCIRLQLRCHTKGIIVDSNEVLLGSHNLTNEGSLFNRDASLLVRDPKVAEYFEKIFLFDWDFLATQEADERAGGVRIAQPGEETPLGFRRISLAEYLGES